MPSVSDPWMPLWTLLRHSHTCSLSSSHRRPSDPGKQKVPGPDSLWLSTPTSWSGTFTPASSTECLPPSPQSTFITHHIESSLPGNKLRRAFFWLPMSRALSTKRTLLFWQSSRPGPELQLLCLSTMNHSPSLLLPTLESPSMTCSGRKREQPS